MHGTNLDIRRQGSLELGCSKNAREGCLPSTVWVSGDLFTIEVDSDSFLGYVTGHIVDTLEKTQNQKGSAQTMQRKESLVEAVQALALE